MQGKKAVQDNGKKETVSKQAQEKKKGKQQDAQKQQDVRNDKNKEQKLEGQGESKVFLRPPNQHPKSEALDKEIDEIAEQIKDANKKKMIHLKTANTGLQNTQQNAPPLVVSEDRTSVQGQFGWTEVAACTIPYITRCGEKYVSLRMADMKIFLKYRQVFTEEVMSCFRLNKLPVTKAEAQLFNEINFRHCDNYFGRLEFGLKDFIVALKDVVEMYEFLNFAYVKLIEKNALAHNNCGFVRISSHNCVPHTWHEGKQFVPLFYFEGECEYLEEKSVELHGWPLAYLKLSCKIQGIRKPLYDNDSIRVVELELLKKFFPPDTLFEDSWLFEANIDALVQRPLPSLVPMQVESKKRPCYEIMTPGAQKKAMQVRPTLQKVPIPIEKSLAQGGYRNAKPLPPPVITPATRTQYVSKPAQNNRTGVLLKPVSPPSGNRPNVLQIPDFVYAFSGCPYFLIRAQIEDKPLNFCVNMEPFMTTTLLVTLEEIATVFFVAPLDLVVNAISVMHLDIFMPNKFQARCLERAKRYPTKGLVKVKDLMDNLPQIRYILTSIQFAQPP